MSHVNSIRIITAEDHPGMRSWIRTLLRHENDIEIVGEAENGQIALDLVQKLHPDLLLLDVEMPVMDGLEVMHHLAGEKNPVCILILSSYDDPKYVEQVKLLGGNGYLTKENSPRQLAGLIRQIVWGEDSRAKHSEAIILPSPPRDPPHTHHPRAG